VTISAVYPLYITEGGNIGDYDSAYSNDLLVVACFSWDDGGVGVTSVGSIGTSDWTIIGPVTITVEEEGESGPEYITITVNIAWAVTTSTAYSVTVNWGGSPELTACGIIEYHGDGSGNTWVADGQATDTYTAPPSSVLSGNFPAISPAQSEDVYFAAGQINPLGDASGSTSGFTYENLSALAFEYGGALTAYRMDATEPNTYDPNFTNTGFEGEYDQGGVAAAVCIAWVELIANPNAIVMTML
jgi:hypothetical protein